MVAELVSTLRATFRVAWPPCNDERSCPSAREDRPPLWEGASSDRAAESLATFIVVMSTPAALAVACSAGARDCAEVPTKPTTVGLVGGRSTAGPTINTTATRVVIPVKIQVARPRSRSVISRSAMSRIVVTRFNWPPAGGRAQPGRRIQNRNAQPALPASRFGAPPVYPCLALLLAALRRSLC